MDREKRYERLQKAYNVLVFGENYSSKNYNEIIEESYKKGRKASNER